MHDLDRTMLEAEPYEGMFEFSLGDTGLQEHPFTEAEALDLASELLTVSSEAELDNFLGNLIKKAWKGAKSLTNSSIGKAVVGGLKSVARQALPMVGAAIGNFVAPGIGGAVGSKLASGAGKLLGLELEGLSAEDQEFEIAKQFVQLAGATARNASTAPATAQPASVARAALTEAAKVYAPGIVPALARANGGTASVIVPGQSGRWIRRGNRIIILGV